MEKSINIFSTAEDNKINVLISTKIKNVLDQTHTLLTQISAVRLYTQKQLVNKEVFFLELTSGFTMGNSKPLNQMEFKQLMINHIGFIKK